MERNKKFSNTLEEHKIPYFKFIRFDDLSFGAKSSKYVKTMEFYIIYWRDDTTYCCIHTISGDPVKY